MKKFIIFPILFVYSYSYSQNLVPNPGFEEHDTCPNSSSQIEYAIGWWTSRQSPDYFNECGSGLAAIPYNGMGFQQAYSGQAYSGLFTFISAGGEYSEIIAAELTSVMKRNYYYKVGFSTNRADGIVNRRLASNNLGVLFSTVKYEYPSIFPIDNFSHFKIDSVITDTTNWLNVEFEFQADSEYKYMMIGNFYSNELTDTILYIHGGSRSYYYIDDVFVIEDTSNSVNKLWIKKINTYYKENNQLIIENAKGNNIKIIDVAGNTILNNESIESDNYVIELFFPLIIIVIITTISSVIYIKKHINPKN